MGDADVTASSHIAEKIVALHQSQIQGVQYPNSAQALLYVV